MNNQRPLFAIAFAFLFSFATALPAAEKDHEFPLNLLFSRADVPRIQANAELPLFQDYWQSLLDADFATDNQYLREAFLYAITGDSARGENARQGMLAMLKEERWDMYMNAKGETLGFLRGGRNTAWMSLGYDWIYPLLSPAEREEILDQIAEKGCVPFTRSLHGMKYPETVEQWQFTPEFADIYEVRDMSRWPTILGKNNFRAVLSGGFALGLTALEGRDDRVEEWKAILLESYDRSAELYGRDGSYDEGIAYANYANTYLVYLVEVMQRRHGIDLFDRINYVGMMDRNLELAFPHYLDPSGSINFGDAGTSMNTSNLLWAAGKSRDGVTQYQALNFATQHDLFSLVYYDPSVTPVAPDDSGHFSQLEFDWITTRTGYELDDLVVSMRSGPPANHEHGDRNSVILKYAGEILLSDTNRPTYDSKKPEWLLRTAEAHNTILIDGQGHPYIDGSEGTNASEASAEIVRKGERPGYVHWTSDATPAHALTDPDVASVTRSVFVFREIPFVLILDKVLKAETPSQIAARWFVENRDGEGSVNTASSTFTMNRPHAKFYATYASNQPLEVSAEKLPLDETVGVFPYAQVQTTGKTKDALFILAGSPLTSDATPPAIEIQQLGETWEVEVSHGSHHLKLKVFDRAQIPEVEIIELSTAAN